LWSPSPVFDGSLPEIADLASLTDAESVELSGAGI
jgi:hypothetical protein